MDRFIIRKRKISQSDTSECGPSSHDPQPSTSKSEPKPSTSSGQNQQQLLTSSVVSNQVDFNEVNQSSDNTDLDETPTVMSKKKRKVYKQKFKDEWLKTFSWLKLLTTGEKMCLVCKKTIQGGKTHLERHEKKPVHIKNSRNVENTANIMTLFNDPQRDKLAVSVKKAEYKLTMGLVEHNIPMRFMDHLPKLLKSSVNDSEIIKNINCARTKTTQMIFMLKNEAEEINVQILKNQKFSLIIDETTDISVKKCLAIVARFTDRRQATVREALLSLIEVESCTANGLVDSVLKVLRKFEIDYENVIGFAADNCSVMMGQIGGVQAKLKEIVNPKIFVIGCVCHSLHLCASFVATKIPSEVEEFVQDIYNYISRSPKRQKVYQEFQEFIELKPHKLLRLAQTRWLSLEAVVRRILEQWQALMLYFTSEVAEEKELDRPKKILELFSKIEIELYLTFLSFILPLINKLNVEFQSEKPKIHLLYDRVSSLYKNILKCFLKNSYVEKSNIFEINLRNVHEYLPNEDIYLGQKTDLLIKKYNIKAEELRNFYNNCLNFYIELCLQIRLRFKNLPQYEFLKLLNPEVLLEKPVSFTPLLEQFSNLTSNNVEEIACEGREICSLAENLKKN